MGSVNVNDRVKQIAENAGFKGRNKPTEDNIPLQGKTPLETNTGRLQGIADTNAKLREQSRAIMTEYSENRRRAGHLRAEIATGARDGDDLLTLFDKAVKCIECMTGDTAFYKSVMKNVNNR